MIFIKKKLTIQSTTEGMLIFAYKNQNYLIEIPIKLIEKSIQ